MNQAPSGRSLTLELPLAQPEELSPDLCALELMEFRQAMPEETAGLSARVVEMAFRVLYEAIEEHEPEIDLDAMTDWIIRSLREIKIMVIHPFNERLFSFLDAAMRFLAEGHGYSKRGTDVWRADIARLIWPYVARARGPEGAVDSLVDAVLDYYESHDEISTAEAADWVLDRHPGLLDWDMLNMLLNEIFDFLCENGQISEYE